ncbi:hypothetical protein [Candidatus Magnetomonas plexicatena]|uniref:hypothetical protein n=1 Tax=Candidatus Magnetomonas plexicatena TaxID=2552947 RepID=UPI001C75D2DE|nr:hypothetical protein E2O03_008625 [Nitrospirales bacterium LBB_01]
MKEMWLTKLQRGWLFGGFILLLILFFPLHGFSETTPELSQPNQTSPSISQPLVREGHLAVKIVQEFSLSTTADEIESETILGDIGIAPRNGWIADYPITPDIVGEIQKTIINSVDTRKLKMSKDEAISKYQKVFSDIGVNVLASNGQDRDKTSASSASLSDNKTVINNYYIKEGPPVITYYVPPPAYLYMYAWVDYPFWYYGFWFPGYYILNDFHKVVIVGGTTVFITNHFRDAINRRVLRIDPVDRFRGKTFSGIGAPHHSSYGSIHSGYPGGGRRNFSRPREHRNERGF